PPLRPLFTRLLQHKLLVVAGLVTLIAMFYAVENWRGRKAWNEYQRAQEKQGVRLGLESVVPSPVPAALNMFEAEPWTDLRFDRSADGQGVIFRNTNAQNEIWFDCYGPNSANTPSGTDLFTARRLDPAAWQQYYRGTNNLSTATNGAAQNYFPT